MPGTGEGDVRSGPPEGGAAGPGGAHGDGIRSLHERLDELERMVARRVETEGKRESQWLRQHGDLRNEVPAWRRRTEGETRWTVAIVTAIGIALQTAVPNRLLLLRPVWLAPAVQGAFLVALVAVNPHRINKDSRLMRTLSLIVAAMLSLANGWSVALLAIGITDGTLGKTTTAKTLLITGVAIWLTNVIAFALWYWELDRGGPVARALATHPYPDFQFPQMTAPDMAPPHWEPAFADYLYLAFTNAAAFSPTDVMPMSHWAKMLMTVQSILSIVTVALVVARAVNILP